MCNVPEAKPNSSTRTNITRRRANRAKRACLSCRSRKVRCDVTRQSPCSNCKWNTADCVVIESRKSPVRKKRKEHEKGKSGSSQDDNLKNTKRADVGNSSLSIETHSSRQIQYEDFTDLQDFVNNTSTTCQLAQVELFEHSYDGADKKGDAMEWAFLEDPSMCSKTASSFVDSGFHDESWYWLEQHTVATVATPSTTLSTYAHKHKLDTFVCSVKAGVNEPVEDLLDSLLALPFDFLRHI
ncbi:hypothetical protein EDB82DRAFT_475027 [Fusarium venenatum]|uniref:uncharacterized protein n=1 Tax=Fusarium venenatum TaxID=56646 RepID=UPI001DA5CACF|nr:hypothetical protein EDB82DRAFT_475027 [Fusarium venenatum]